MMRIIITRTSSQKETNKTLMKTDFVLNLVVFSLLCWSRLRDVKHVGLSIKGKNYRLFLSDWYIGIIFLLFYFYYYISITIFLLFYF